MTPFRRPTLREPQLFLILALLIGVFSGLAVVCFRVAIEAVRFWLLGSEVHPSPARFFLVLPAIGLVIAVLVELVFPVVRGSGVNQTKAAVYIYDGFIAFRTVVGKFITSALAIGGGYSLGPEDPSLQIGAGLASAIGRSAGLSRDRLRLIAPVGAAAGLAAAFNSPITAVLFVIEEVIGTWSAVALGAVVVAAVSSVVVQHWFLGDQPLFHIPEYHLAHTNELLVYAVLGVAGGIAALVFVKLALSLRPRLRALPRWTWFLQPSLAGLVIAVVAIWFPQVTGAGYEAIDQAMHDRYVWHVLAALAALKIVTTVVSFASGTPGGLFAPTLFIGAMLGGAICTTARAWVPGFEGSTGAYALIGMGTAFAGILRAPITSVFMIVEISGNYSIVLPVMIANTIAYLVSRQYQREALFDVLSRQDGTTLPSMEEQRETVVHRVEDALFHAAVVLASHERVADAADRIPTSTVRHVLAQSRPAAWAVVPAETLEAFVREGKGEELVGGVLGSVPPVPILYRDQTLDVALRLLGAHPFLPVVHRADSGKLIGIVDLESILGVYRRSGAR